MKRLALVAILHASVLLAQDATVRSPNGEMEISFHIVPKSGPTAGAGGQLVYEVSFRGKPVVEPSALRLDLQGRAPLGADVMITKAERSSHDETYKLVTGKVSAVRDHYNAIRVDVEESGEYFSRRMSVEARAYDDAVAFRYVMPEQPPLSEFRLSREGTQFRLSKDATTYSLVLPNYRTMYESEFVKLPISAFANQGGIASSSLIGLPLLMEVPGVAWVAIAEADLKDYSSLYLVNESGGWSAHGFEARLAPDLNDPDIAVSGTLPHHSAWRVIQVADAPGKLIESTVLASLNPPQAIQDTSWIRPGKASWDWWSGSIGRDGKPAFTTETMKYYVDFASDSGFEYMLVDAGWSAIGDITRMNGRVDIPELVKYATGKKVRVWIWLHWAAVDKQMEDAFALYERWGVAGVKIDFVSHDDQNGIRWYYRTVESAAKHHLMVDFHGSTKPSGLDRTWPNVMGYEAVLGMEQSKGGMRDNPDNHVTLPFTRMLAGRMDYTPGGFDNVTREEFVARSIRPMVMGTRAHQLAMYAVYESPFQMVSDHPGAYKDQPSFEFIRSVPATWDETHVLNGTPGEYITVARRHGKEWFVGSMTGWTPRQMELPLGFLGSGKYRAEIYADAEDADKLPKNVSIQKQTVDRLMTLKMRLAPGGGYAVRFVPVNE